MHRSKQSLQREFCCPKCRGRACSIEEVSLPISGPFSLMLPVAAARFHAVSCGLCGFTEFYNLAVLADSKEEAPAAAELASGGERA